MAGYNLLSNYRDCTPRGARSNSARRFEDRSNDPCCVWRKRAGSPCSHRRSGSRFPGRSRTAPASEGAAAEGRAGRPEPDSNNGRTQLKLHHGAAHHADGEIEQKGRTLELALAVVFFPDFQPHRLPNYEEDTQVDGRCGLRHMEHDREGELEP